MFGIGFQEMLIILVVVLIFFGPKRLPDLAKSLGKGIAEFKKASEEVKRGIDEAVKEEMAKTEGEKTEGTPAAMPEPSPMSGDGAVPEAKTEAAPPADAASGAAAADAPHAAPTSKG